MTNTKLVFLTSTLALGGAMALLAQTIDTSAWTTAEDHANMMQQLGIKALRPGPSGTAGRPNQANYDEALANPYPNLPDPLTLKNGKKVTTKDQWVKQRRPEILEEFDREVLGRVPKNVPKVTWTVAETKEGVVGDIDVIGKRLVGHVDNSSYPAINVDIQMTLVVPKNAKGPVPVMMMFGGGGLPLARGEAPPAGKGGFGGPKGAPKGDAAAKGNDAKAKAPPAAPRPPADPPATTQMIAAGWGYASMNPGSIQADNGTSRMTGAPCEPGPGARRAVSTTSKRKSPSTPRRSASKAYRATARRHWSPWRTTSASPSS
jgi:hypothetical protein